MIYEYWLAGIKEITDLKKQKLREVYGSGKAIYYIEETKLDKLRFLNEKDVAILKNAKKDTKLEEKWRRTEEKRIQFIPRNCTAYGEQMALQYGKSLAEAGIQIISGMARGIDGAGQRGALNSSWAKESGVTYAVLGCGVDVCYPRENIGLYMDIQEKGGIVSEFSPGTQPYAWNFPRRNRIISALADWILIMEAKERSGSLITADLALEQGKDVYALPGPVNSVLSQGCHRLIRQGAGILITPEELMDEWNINPVEIGQKGNKSEKMLESPEFMVYSCLDLFPKGTNQLMKETGLSVTELMERLITLELNGYVKEVSRNYYIRLQ